FLHEIDYGTDSVGDAVFGAWERIKNGVTNGIRAVVNFMKELTTARIPLVTPFLILSQAPTTKLTILFHAVLKKSAIPLRIEVIVSLIPFQMVEAVSDTQFQIPDRKSPIDCHEAVNIVEIDRKSTRLNSSHVKISYAVFCLKKKKTRQES